MKQDFYSTSEARKNLSDLVNQVKYGNKQIAIGRHGKAEVMLVPVLAQEEESKRPNSEEHIQNQRTLKNKTIDYNSLVMRREYKKLVKKYSLDLMILFGSHASGKIKSTSDVDIAVYSKKGLNASQEQRLYSELVDLFDRDDVDLVNLNRIYDVVLRYEIFFNGLVLYEGIRNLYAYMRTRAYFDYHDFKPYFKKQDELIEKKLNHLIKTAP